MQQLELKTEVRNSTLDWLMFFLFPFFFFKGQFLIVKVSLILSVVVITMLLEDKVHPSSVAPVCTADIWQSELLKPL